jgi:hypothetical protein
MEWLWERGTGCRDLFSLYFLFTFVSIPCVRVWTLFVTRDRVNLGKQEKIKEMAINPVILDGNISGAVHVLVVLQKRDFV